MYRVWTIAFLISVAAGLGARTADASSLDEQPVIRRQLLLRGGRHELTVQLGATMADSLAHNWMLGGSYQYFFNNWLGAGLGLSFNLCTLMPDTCKTSLAEHVESANPHIDELDGVSAFGALVLPYVTLVPMNGKMGMFGKVVHYDTHLLAGGAILTVGALGGGSELDDTVFGPMWGVGQRVFIDDAMAVTVTLQDLIVSRSANVTESGEPAEEEYENNFLLTVGLSFYFPRKVKVSR